MTLTFRVPSRSRMRFELTDSTSACRKVLNH